MAITRVVCDVFVVLVYLLCPVDIARVAPGQLLRFMSQSLSQRAFCQCLLYFVNG